MALTPAEKQRRYRQRHKDRPTQAQKIVMLEARIAELEAQLRVATGADAGRNHSHQTIDETVIAEWERALGRGRHHSQ
ncbi:hypothetical protein [Magnetospirillum sp. SS-4]|jgi:hypothetical protein|uniref:hypothetical protein n=1 Tax=Magnetospirillum sp. SS-4 TaxID=2681465 RepID=UPI001384C4A7|nr:hypothetical protein [Magnetospirillum sp. SS-4]CAA7624015.1 conserved hypothetical protein [Magnetospirillum sp. SS-4]